MYGKYIFTEVDWLFHAYFQEDSNYKQAFILLYEHTKYKRIFTDETWNRLPYFTSKHTSNPSL